MFVLALCNISPPFIAQYTFPHLFHTFESFFLNSLMVFSCSMLIMMYIANWFNTSWNAVYIIAADFLNLFHHNRFHPWKKLNLLFLQTFHPQNIWEYTYFFQGVWPGWLLGWVGDGLAVSLVWVMFVQVIVTLLWRISSKASLRCSWRELDAIVAATNMDNMAFGGWRG